MTKEYLLEKTLYGADIIQHLIRKEFPDHIMHVSGSSCGECPDPVWADGSVIEVTIDRIPVEGQKLPDYRARFHYPDGQLLDGDAIALATAYYHERGEDLSQEEIIARLAEEMFIPEPRKTLAELECEKRQQEESQAEPEPAKPALPPCARMSFFRRPIRNTRPCRDASPQDIYKYLVSDYAREHTEHLRTIKDSKERSRYKAEHFDYVTWVKSRTNCYRRPRFRCSLTLVLVARKCAASGTNTSVTTSNTSGGCWIPSSPTTPPKKTKTGRMNTCLSGNSRPSSKQWSIV